MKFQQCSGPIMAKGVEDTAFYTYNRLVALNEVGGKPEQFGIDLADFHTLNPAGAENGRIHYWGHPRMTPREVKMFGCALLRSRRFPNSGQGDPPLEQTQQEVSQLK